MREIKFRGRDGKHWLFGSLAMDKCGNAAILDDDNFWSHPVRAETVGQFTGLTDADGREIYEGDILRQTRDTGAVFWNSAECRWCVEMNDGLVFILATRNANSWHVIGNVHDNPDLLTDAKD